VVRIALLVLAWLAVAAPLSAADTGTEDPWGDEPWPPAAEDDTGGAGTDSAEAGAAPGAAFGSPAVELYGSLTTTGEVQLGDAGDPARGDDLAVGTATRTRLKGDWEPDDRVLTHIELVAQHRSGVLNPYTYAQASGFDGGATTTLESENPQDDFAESLYLDQAWAQLRFDRFDLQIGKQPIAWGTGYAFNPTVRTHLSGGPAGLEDDETPGTAAISVGVPIAGSLVAEGYLAFEDRTHASFTAAREVDPAYLPWGSRVRMLIGSFDLAVGAIHEVVAPAAGGAGSSGAAGPGLERYLHAAAETVGSIGDLGVYAEAAWTMPVWDATRAAAAAADWDALEALESTVGLEYMLPGDFDIKLEYYRRGGGATVPASYDPSQLLSGRTTVMARDYLFGYIARTFVSYLEVSVAALANLNDGSVLVLQQSEYAVSDNISMSLAGLVPTGSGNEEFGGTREIGDTELRIVRPTIIAQLEVSF
jgi:hypothetical protein